MRTSAACSPRPPTAHGAPTGIGGLGEVAFALIVVLAAIFLVAWLLRRMRIVGNRVGAAHSTCSPNVQLGPKERAVLLNVGTTQILIGVAPGHVNTLHVLTEPLELRSRRRLPARRDRHFRRF